jgi:hypothetical protein
VHCGGTVGGVWKKPVVAEEGLRLDILFSSPARWQGGRMKSRLKSYLLGILTSHVWRLYFASL